MALVETVRSILESKGNEVWSLSPEATVYEAVAVMADKGVGALLVVSEGRLAGIVSERDYARKVILKAKSSKHTLLRDVMTSTVVTVTPDNTVDECMRIMTKHRIRHLPVLEGDRLSGVISIGDLVSSIISAQAATIDQLHNYIAGKYPG
jgi:CBS domain-containing protein